MLDAWQACLHGLYRQLLGPSAAVQALLSAGDEVLGFLLRVFYGFRGGGTPMQLLLSADAAAGAAGQRSVMAPFGALPPS
jgi:hypothetical protein